MNRQLLEIASWRVAAELLRRYPERWHLVETHPGGGQDDCLSLIPRHDAPPATPQIHLNRPGSVHLWTGPHPWHIQSWSGFWDAWAAAPDPRAVLDLLCRQAGLPPPQSLAPTTPTVLVARTIAAFLTHAAFGRTRWEGRNGFLDTAGGEWRVRSAWFDPFPAARRRLAVRDPSDVLGQPAYRFWFLLRDDEPELCLETSGLAWSRRGSKHHLPSLYHQERRLWPLVSRIAGHLLP